MSFGYISKSSKNTKFPDRYSGLLISTVFVGVSDIGCLQVTGVLHAAANFSSFFLFMTMESNQVMDII